MRFPAFIVAFLLFLTIVVSSLVIPSNASAQQVAPIDLGTENNVPSNVHTLTQTIFIGMLSSMTCFVGGVDFASANRQCLAYNPKSGKIGYAPTGGGVLGMMSNATAILYTSPFHTGDYLRYMASNFGLVKKADAASTGFDQLAPITKLWIGFRNLVYLLFVVVFVIIGFAIMLRAKIDPRTVMTIENQIPKIIIALILVTFSFAIAGLMIDIMWLLVYATINIFASLDPQLQTQVSSITSGISLTPFDFANNISGAPGGFLGISWQVAQSIYSISLVITKNLVDNATIAKWILAILPGLPLTLGCILQSIGGTAINWVTLGHVHLGNDFGSCVTDAVTTSVSSVAFAISFLIFAIALIVALARLWWILIKAYSLFLVYVIFGPFFIMMGLLPGSKINFDNWIRHVAAYLFVFPLSMGILLLGRVLMDAYSTTNGFVPPMIGLNQNSSLALGPLLGFAIIMLVPQALTMIQDALAAPDMKYLPGIGQMIGVGAKYYGTAAGGLWNRSWRPSDPLHNLDEGWLRKLTLPKGSLRRRILIGKETGTIKPSGK